MRSALGLVFCLVCSFSYARAEDPLAFSPGRPYRPLQNFKNSSRHLLDKQNQLTIVGATATLLLARASDNGAKEYFAHKERIGRLDRLGSDFLGTGVPGVLLGAGFWLYGDRVDSDEWMHFGQAQLEAMLMTSLATTALKYTVRRERPNGDDHLSFPSGHTSTVFASAMVFHEFYGWKAGVPGFMLGAITAMSRMSDDKHWLSDTVGGATLGLVFGHAFSQVHRKAADSPVAVIPEFLPGGMKLSFIFTQRPVSSTPDFTTLTSPASRAKIL